MSRADKARAEQLARYRSALVQACGIASMIGRQEDAVQLGEMIGRAMLDNMKTDKPKKPPAK